MPIQLTEENKRKIPHAYLIKLQTVYDSLKSAEKKAADFVLSQSDFFVNATITEAAEQAECSEATFVRLAKRLGYSGYPEMKAAFSEEMYLDKTTPYNDIGAQDEPLEVMAKVFKSSIQALTDTLQIIDKEEYTKALKTIDEARKILFCGVGDAFAVIRSGYQKFLRMGMDVQASADMDIQLICLANMSAGDVMIVVSHSGRTKNILEVVKYARNKGIIIIAITNYAVSPLVKNADIILLTSAFTEHLSGEIMSKRVTQLCVLESLYINLLLINGTDFKNQLSKSNGALEVNKF